MIVLVTLYNFLSIPFRLAFQASSETIFLSLDLFSDLILILDIFLRFNLAYLDQGDEIERLRAAARIGKRLAEEKLALAFQMEAENPDMCRGRSASAESDANAIIAALNNGGDDE